MRTLNQNYEVELEQVKSVLSLSNFQLLVAVLTPLIILCLSV